MGRCCQHVQVAWQETPLLANARIQYSLSLFALWLDLDDFARSNMTMLHERHNRNITRNRTVLVISSLEINFILLYRLGHHRGWWNLCMCRHLLIYQDIDKMIIAFGISNAVSLLLQHPAAELSLPINAWSSFLCLHPSMVWLSSQHARLVRSKLFGTSQSSNICCEEIGCST